MAKSGGVFNSDNVTIFLSELLGTALLVFFGCSSCIEWSEHGVSSVSTLRTVFSFGLAVLISVQIFGCVSGAHINPAVTVAALIYKLINIPLACAYVVAQCLGAFMGYGLLVTLTPHSLLVSSFCVTKVHHLLNVWQAFTIEFLATGVFIWFCCGIWDPRNAKSHDSVPLRFGLAVTGLASATCHFTGGSFNPARSLGPAIWTGDYDGLWLYWLAPMSAAVVAAVIYRYIFRREVIEAEVHDHNLENLSDESTKV